MPMGVNSDQGMSRASIRSARMTSPRPRTRAIACSRVTTAETAAAGTVDGEGDGAALGAATSLRRAASAAPAAINARVNASTSAPRMNRITCETFGEPRCFAGQEKEAGSRRPLHVHA